MKFIMLFSLLFGCASLNQKSELASDGVSPGQLRGLVAINKHIKSKLFDGSLGSLSWSLGYYMKNDLTQYRTFLGSWQSVGLRAKYTGENQNPFNLMIWWLTIEQFAEQMSEVCDPAFSGFIRTLNGGNGDARLNPEASKVFVDVCKTPSQDNIAELWKLYVDPFEEDEAKAFAAAFMKSQYKNQKDAVKQAIQVMSFHPMFLIHRG